jgi:hypothetical protein
MPAQKGPAKIPGTPMPKFWEQNLLPGATNSPNESSGDISALTRFVDEQLAKNEQRAKQGEKQLTIDEILKIAADKFPLDDNKNFPIDLPAEKGEKYYLNKEIIEHKKLLDVLFEEFKQYKDRELLDPYDVVISVDPALTKLGTNILGEDDKIAEISFHPFVLRLPTDIFRMLIRIALAHEADHMAYPTDSEDMIWLRDMERLKAWRFLDKFVQWIIDEENRNTDFVVAPLYRDLLFKTRLASHSSWPQKGKGSIALQNRLDSVWIVLYRWEMIPGMAHRT